MNIVQDEQKEKIPKGRGFYITLAICCTAVIAAGWSTYKSIKGSSGVPQLQSDKYSNKSNDDASQNMSISDTLDGSNSKANERRDKHQNSKNGKDQEYDDMLAEEEDIQSVLSDSTDALVVYPTNNNVIKEFSDGKPVYSKTLGDWRVHDGVDFKADRGSMVKSITGGTVKDVYNDPSYGTTIVIEHSLGFVGYYSGLGETVIVKTGDSVKAGDEIGSISNVPVEIAEEPHLHLMINKDGKFIDPILVLDKETD